MLRIVKSYVQKKKNVIFDVSIKCKKIYKIIVYIHSSGGKELVDSSKARAAAAHTIFEFEN